MMRGRLKVLITAYVLCFSLCLERTDAFVNCPSLYRDSRSRCCGKQPIDEALFWTKTPNGSRVSNEPIPFIIEPLPSEHERVDLRIYTEISEMCISAFFNDGSPEEQRQTPLWKQAQLSYLRNLQAGDLRLRRLDRSDSNFMLVARRVVPITPENVSKIARKTPLILNTSEIQNYSNGDGIQDFVRGEILGFVEVTKRPYGLGSLESEFPPFTSTPLPRSKAVKYKSNSKDTIRPVLTNLSVDFQARRSGLGSALVQRCEQEVLQRWKSNKEIILEVEEDNLRALDFYKKRGYKVLFTDPTSRRYDVTGLWLQKKRCKRYIMRKDLAANPIFSPPQEVRLGWDMGLQTLRKVLLSPGSSL